MTTSWMSMKSLPPLEWSEPYPLFNRVSLETIGKCTRECECCPSRFRTKEQQGEMSDEVFDTIMIQLSDLKFDGTLQLFYLGEPLLDEKIVERTHLARSACPRAKLLIASNGDLLKRVEQIEELFDAGMNIINVDCYDKQVYDRVVDLAANTSVDVETEWDKVRWTSPSSRSKIIVVIDVCKPEIARQAACHTYLVPEIERILKENGMLALKKQKWCAQPHRRLVVWWSGEVVLCCVVTPLINNPPIVGSYKNLLEAWNSPMMRDYRFRLQEGNKQGVCVDCYYKHAYPHVVRRITKPPF